MLVLTVKKLWCYVGASAALNLGLKLPHTLLHHDGAVYVTVGFVQYVSD